MLVAKTQAGALCLRSGPIALRTMIEQAIDQLPLDLRSDFSIEGSDSQSWPTCTIFATHLEQFLVIQDTFDVKKILAAGPNV